MATHSSNNSSSSDDGCLHAWMPPESSGILCSTNYHRHWTALGCCLLQRVLQCLPFICAHCNIMTRNAILSFGEAAEAAHHRDDAAMAGTFAA